MNQPDKKTSLSHAREILGDQRLLAFLQAINSNSSSILACKLINENLGQAKTLDAFTKDSKTSCYHVQIHPKTPDHFHIEFSCLVTVNANHPFAESIGDGGTWSVTFSGDQLQHFELLSQWIT